MLCAHAHNALELLETLWNVFLETDLTTCSSTTLCTVVLRDYSGSWITSLFCKMEMRNSDSCIHYHLVPPMRSSQPNASMVSKKGERCTEGVYFLRTILGVWNDLTFWRENCLNLFSRLNCSRTARINFSGQFWYYIDPLSYLFGC